MGGEKNHPLQKRALSGQALFIMNFKMSLFWLALSWIFVETLSGFFESRIDRDKALSGV